MNFRRIAGLCVGFAGIAHLLPAVVCPENRVTQVIAEFGERLLEVSNVIGGSKESKTKEE